MSLISALVELVVVVLVLLHRPVIVYDEGCRARGTEGNRKPGVAAEWAQRGLLAGGPVTSVPCNLPIYRLGCRSHLDLRLGRSDSLPRVRARLGESRHPSGTPLHTSTQSSDEGPALITCGARSSNPSDGILTGVGRRGVSPCLRSCR